MNLKPFNPKAVCLKCGSRTVGSVYHAAHERSTYDSPAWNNDDLRAVEHIVRRCRRCGYYWAEEPMKAGKPADR